MAENHRTRVRLDRDAERELSPRRNSRKPSHRSRRISFDEDKRRNRSISPRESDRKRRRSTSWERNHRPQKRRSLSYEEEDRDRDRRHRHRSERKPGSTSPSKPLTKRRDSVSPKTPAKSRGPLASQQDAFKNNDGTIGESIEKQKPNFANSGKLAAASNTVKTAGQTIVLKYHEPPEGRKPPAKEPWRMYVFKGEEIMATVELAEQSCWLFGRETAIADFPIEHPSCSKQHAAIQFRYIEKRNEFGDKTGRVRPYLIDLESANSTFVNDEQIPAAKYVEVRDKDVLKFGQSTREYVIQLPK